MKLKRTLLAGVLACALLASAGCSTGTSTDSADSGNAASGTLTVYTSQPEEDIQKFVEAFNEEYPDVTVDVFRSGTEEVISKVLAEKQANALQADVLLVSDAPTFESLKEQDLLASYESPELEGIDSQYYDEEHTYCGTKVISTGIMYNTDMVQTAPTSLKDLTSEAAKDNVSMPSPLYSGAAAYNLSLLTRTDGFGWEFYQALKDNGVKVGQGNGTVQKAVTGGEVGYGLIADYLAIRAKADGAPVDFVYPEEGSPAVTEPVGIVNGTDNETAAQAFVDFILSDRGQEVTAEIGYTPIKSGVAAPEGFRTVDEIQTITYDTKTLADNREADKQQFSQIFGE